MCAIAYYSSFCFALVTGFLFYNSSIFGFLGLQKRMFWSWLFMVQMSLCCLAASVKVLKETQCSENSPLASLWPPCIADADIIFLPCGLFFLSFFPRLISAVTEWMSTILLHMVWP